MSGTGWTYMLILTFTSGVAAQGLLVFAQKTIQIGTIGIAQVAQPALAVVWSFLLLGEVVNDRQVAGIAIVDRRAAGLRRAEPARRSRGQADLPDRAGVGPVALGDEVRGGLHAPVGGLAEVPRRGGVARLGGDAGERVEGEDLDRGVVVAAGGVEDRDEPLLRAGDAVVGVERREQAVAERGLLAAAGVAVPRRRRLERRPRRARSARARAGRARGAPGRAPPGGRRRSPRPSRSRAPAWPRRSRSRRPGTARARGWRAGRPRSAGSRAGPTSPPPGRCGATASSKRCSTRASSPSIASRRTCSHGSSTRAQPVLDLVARLGGARAVAGRDRGPGGEERVRGLVPRPVQPVVERAGCDRSAPARAPTRRGATRRRRGSSRSAPAGRRRRSRRPARRRRRRARGPARGGRSTPRSTPRAAARRPGRGPGPRRPRRRARPGSAARRGCRRGRSRPSRTR